MLGLSKIHVHRLKEIELGGELPEGVHYIVKNASDSDIASLKEKIASGHKTSILLALSDADGNELVSVETPTQHEADILLDSDPRFNVVMRRGGRLITAGHRVNLPFIADAMLSHEPRPSTGRPVSISSALAVLNTLDFVRHLCLAKHLSARQLELQKEHIQSERFKIVSLGLASDVQVISTEKAILVRVVPLGSAKSSYAFRFDCCQEAETLYQRTLKALTVFPEGSFNERNATVH